MTHTFELHYSPSANSIKGRKKLMKTKYICLMDGHKTLRLSEKNVGDAIILHIVNEAAERFPLKLRLHPPRYFVIFHKPAALMPLHYLH